MTDDFSEYVEQNLNWTFVKSHIDDGRSGLPTRKGFLNLLTAGALGKNSIRLITGEPSCFGRNTNGNRLSHTTMSKNGCPVRTMTAQRVSRTAKYHKNEVTYQCSLTIS